MDDDARISSNQPTTNTALVSYYSAAITDFLDASPNEIFGTISVNSGFAVEPLQRDAWVAQIEILKPALESVAGSIFFEFCVPRIGSRIDAVVISASTIFVIEFKVGERHFHRADVNQVWDYGLDLKNFHKASHHASIVPILVATAAPRSVPQSNESHLDGVSRPICCNSQELRSVIHQGLLLANGNPLDVKVWAESPYRPTPTIIEAAQALYANHSVEAIARYDAGAVNLALTSQCIETLIDETQRQSKKAIIFVTGVPGAGKTLVGLNVATKKRDPDQPTHAVFLSGNGPLVEVLSEALTRDEVMRLRKSLDMTRKGEVRQKVKAFIQNVHHFRDAGLIGQGSPSDHVVIFDEAQRAWNREMTSDFMRRKKRQVGFDQSEPEFLIAYMDRHKDWAVVVCLVGGGQEINRGEAGISAWLDAVKTKFPHWQVYISKRLTDGEYAAGRALDSLAGRDNIVEEESLHLAVSMRSFRAEHLSSFVKALLDCDTRRATELFASIRERYPLSLTRDLKRAKQWIRNQSRGSERFGLVASSGAQRLKPHAVDVRVQINPIHWFLNDRDDTRSSFYLEDAATEFQVQGLELDWVCMTWDADLRFAELDWRYHSFVGSKWTNVHKPDRQQYLRNAYRVLLTRARQGMVIFVPNGDNEDATRSPAFYDSTFEYLSKLGIPVLT